MWNRFTDRARKVILIAQAEAQRLGSASVGTEHLLLGLVRENEGVAAQVLERMGLNLSSIRAEVEQQSATQGNAPSSGEPILSPSSKRALELAADEARRMKHNYIGTEHLLLALIRGMDGQASKVLHKFGLNLENARQHVRQYLGPETPGGLGAERPRISHPQRKKKAEPKPDLEEVSEQLLQLVQSTIDDVAVGEKRDRLKELHADLERVIGQVRDKSRASEFEQLTKELLDGVGWYKDRAVAAGKTEMADRILELQKRVETVLEEIRNLIHPDPGESESKQL